MQAEKHTDRVHRLRDLPLSTEPDQSDFRPRPQRRPSDCRSRARYLSPSTTGPTPNARFREVTIQKRSYAELLTIARMTSTILAGKARYLNLWVEYRRLVFGTLSKAGQQRRANF